MKEHESLILHRVCLFVHTESKTGQSVSAYLWGGPSVCGDLVLLQQATELVLQRAQSQARGQA